MANPNGAAPVPAPVVAVAATFAMDGTLGSGTGVRIPNITPPVEEVSGCIPPPLAPVAPVIDRRLVSGPVWRLPELMNDDPSGCGGGTGMPKCGAVVACGWDWTRRPCLRRDDNARAERRRV